MMKKMMMFVSTIGLTLLAVNAQSVDIYADVAGGYISLGGYGSPKEVICGTGAMPASQSYNGISFFQLPTNRIEAANLTLIVDILYGSWTNANAAIDLWGIGYMRTPVLNAASKAWTLMGDTDTQSLINNTFPYVVQSTKIADNIVTNGQSVVKGDVFTLNAGQRANLLAFINTLYEKGALPGDYAVIRANPDAVMTAVTTSVRFGGTYSTIASPDRRPKLTVTLTDDPAPTPAEFEINHFSHSNDGTVFLTGVSSGYDLISGTLANPSIDGSGIAFFALPEQSLTSASLSLTVATFWNALTVANIDVWGLGYTNTPIINKTWLCTNDVDFSVLLNGYPPVKLADNIVTSGQTVAVGDVWQPTAGQQTNLVCYLNGLYEQGAKPGDFAIIRFNMDSTQAGEVIGRGVRWGGSHQTNPEQRAFLSGYYPATTNYLVNAGFEAGTAGVPSNWSIDDRGFLGQQTNESARSGGYAFRMSVNGDQSGNSENNLNITQNVNSPDFAGRLVTLSGYVRHDTTEPLVSGSVQKVEVRIYWIGGSAGGTWETSTDYHNLLPTDVKDAYKPIYISAEAPADVTGIKTMVIFRSGTTVDPLITTGVAFVDDLRLTVFELLPPTGTLILLR